MKIATISGEVQDQDLLTGSDSIKLMAECLSIDSENYLFLKLNKEYLDDFKLYN